MQTADTKISLADYRAEGKIKHILCGDYLVVKGRRQGPKQVNFPPMAFPGSAGSFVSSVNFSLASIDVKLRLEEESGSLTVEADQDADELILSPHLATLLGLSITSRFLPWQSGTRVEGGLIDLFRPYHRMALIAQELQPSLSSALAELKALGIVSFQGLANGYLEADSVLHSFTASLDTSIPTLGRVILSLGSLPTGTSPCLENFHFDCIIQIQ